MEAPDIITIVIPLWLTLIAAECLYGRWRGRNWSRLNDMVNSLSLGSIYTMTSVITKVVGLVTYLFFYEYAAFNLPANSPWVWLLAFVLYDVCYYWNHRFVHEVNILWASHSVHHQSEDYNLSTALRQSSSSFITSWIFYVPMALLGVSPLVFLAIGGLSAVYQFWIHTRHVPKLGWLEKIIVTPSSHRVHHGSNEVYMDKNYGGVFIVWDRFFGSYQEELDEEPVGYGISRPLRSWNPLWANLIGYVELVQDAYRAQRWQDKYSIWFRKTGWRPADVEARYPRAKRSKNYTNYDVKPSDAVSVYGAVHYLLTSLLGLGYLSIADDQSLIFNVAMVVMFVLQLTLISRLFENKSHTLMFELFRLLGIILTVFLCESLGLLSVNSLMIALVSLLLSAVVAVSILRGQGESSLQPLKDKILESL